MGEESWAGQVRVLVRQLAASKDLVATEDTSFP